MKKNKTKKQTINEKKKKKDKRKGKKKTKKSLSIDNIILRNTIDMLYTTLK